jgi:hypothetical protein
VVPDVPEVFKALREPVAIATGKWMDRPEQA